MASPPLASIIVAWLLMAGKRLALNIRPTQTNRCWSQFDPKQSSACKLLRTRNNQIGKRMDRVFWKYSSGTYLTFSNIHIG